MRSRTWKRGLRTSVRGFLTADEAHWPRHDVAVLPPFRRRLTELSGYAVIRGTQDVDTRDAILPVYRCESQTAMPDAPDARLALSVDVVPETDDAVGWDRDLFERVWTDATAMGLSALRFWQT